MYTAGIVGAFMFVICIVIIGITTEVTDRKYNEWAGNVVLVNFILAILGGIACIVALAVFLITQVNK